MGTAIREVFADHELICKGRDDFDAHFFDVANCIEGIIDQIKPEVLINTVAYMGIDLCEINPDMAMNINALFPGKLAKLSNKYDFTFVHFSTDAVFPSYKHGYYYESDRCHPVNLYGDTKHFGDRCVQSLTSQYYILRLPVLFGPTEKKTQFVEKMLDRIAKGEKRLRIADDIISSPTYSIDVARRVRFLLENGFPYGLYHTANRGMASLYALMSEIVKHSKIDCEIEKASYKDFEFVGMKNTFTPIRSSMIGDMRPWQDAVKEYCETRGNIG